MGEEVECVKVSCIGKVGVSPDVFGVIFLAEQYLSIP